jgi:hypothetical protein
VVAREEGLAGGAEGDVAGERAEDEALEELEGGEEGRADEAGGGAYERGVEEGPPDDSEVNRAGVR